MAETGKSTAPSESADERETSAQIGDLRGAIDSVDQEILGLLNRRAELAREIGGLKRSHGAPIYVASRERDLVAKLARDNEGPFPDSGIAHVFREIISATRSLEELVRVAFLGPQGTFSHQAAMRQFGAFVEHSAATSIAEVFDWTERGVVQYGIVPIENTSEGVVTASFDCLVEAEVQICGELLLDISETLLSQSGDLEQIRRVASHPQPLAQCQGWLQSHLPGAERIETASTASAAQLASREPDVAAIGSEVAAEAYGLSVVATGIEDRRGNSTRFLVIGRETPRPSGDDLTSAVFTVRKDQSGTLYRLLEPFARCAVNLTSIQSRPMKGKPWEYLFFVDMEGHQRDEAVAKALAEASASAHSYKILGSFPRTRVGARRSS